MQTHVSEAAGPEDNMLACFARGSRLQKMLFKMSSTFNDGEEAQCRFTFSEELPPVARHPKETNFE
jgi:hypothetical protein